MSRYFSKPRYWGAALALTLAVCAVPLVVSSQPPAGDAPVKIKVRLPADALLTVDGQLTRQTGPEREFISPPLPAGRKFSYLFEATWSEGGKKKTAREKLAVQAGGEYSIDFLKAAKDGKQDVDKQDADKKKRDKKDTKKDTPRDTKKDDLKDVTKDDFKDIKKDTFKDLKDIKKDDFKKDDVKKDFGKEARGPKTREFNFTYAASVKGLKPGARARVWLPVAPSNQYQTVKIVQQNVPGKASRDKEAKFGNEILYTEATANKDGTIPLSITYRVQRKEVLGNQDAPPVTAEQREESLKPDRLVPVGGKPAKVLLNGKSLPASGLQLGKSLYDIVNDHMVYSKKGNGWGEGDAEWACDSKYGNCTDFHSLFISLSRTRKMPAKFEMGFPIPEKQGKGEVGGYHCWAWFSPDGKRWLPVDISEANRAKETNPKMVAYYFGNLTEDRVTFTTGRDLTLQPPQAGSPVNYLIYPYVEVDGKPYSTVERKFSYEDVR
jgi:uncharacterized protein (TIGR03000 family)